MSRPNRSGFTLVELLIVIGIIALLISILAPALSRARESARRTVCASNLHQLFLGVQMYAHDNRGRMIPKYELKLKVNSADNIAKGIKLNTPDEGIQTVLQKYVGLQVFQCPADSGDYTSPTPVFEQRGTSYAINGADPTSTDPAKTKFNLKHYRDFGGDMFKPWDSETLAAIRTKIDAGQMGPKRWHQKFYNILMADGRVESIFSKTQELNMEKR